MCVEIRDRDKTRRLFFLNCDRLERDFEGVERGYDTMTYVKLSRKFLKT